MAGSLQDMYVQVLLDRVRGERFPNPDHLDRIEASVRNPKQVREYLELLLSRVDGTRYPSGDLLDRIAGLAAEEESARRRAAARQARSQG